MIDERTERLRVVVDDYPAISGFPRTFMARNVETGRVYYSTWGATAAECAAAATCLWQAEIVSIEAAEPPRDEYPVDIDDLIMGMGAGEW